MVGSRLRGWLHEEASLARLRWVKVTGRVQSGPSNGPRPGERLEGSEVGLQTWLDKHLTFHSVV